MKYPICLQSVTKTFINFVENDMIQLAQDSKEEMK